MTNKHDIRTLITDLQVRDNQESNTKSIQGYALKFNEPSEPIPFIEFISPHALNGVDLSNVLLLYGHDFNNILARTDANTLTLQVDDKGLFFNAQLADTTLANDVYNDIKAGNLKGCSFGFNIAENGDTWDMDDNGNTVHYINQIANLDEISITPVPAYTETSVQVQRSLDKFLKGKESMAEEKKKEKEEIKNEEPEKKKDDIKEPKKKDESKKDDDATRSVRDAVKSLSDEIRSLKEKLKENKEERSNMGKDITPNNKVDKKAELKRDFAEFLKNGRLTRDVTGLGLSNGEVLIPQTILPPEHEPHQFPRLGSLVRTISVQTTTGKLPVFMDNNGTLALHTEFQPTANSKAPEIKELLWNLHTYTGKYVFSQELINDSSYNWESELGQQLQELRDNTNDNLIMQALTNGVSPITATDLIAALKNVLDVTLKPVDSANASIILSQSAFAALDQMNDGMNRPLVQPDVTKGMGHTVLGKTVVVVDDTLFPSAKQGDVNAIVAPLQKAVINFKSAEITGKFQDTSDIWYKQLGIFLREDVEQARKDLISYIKVAPKAAK